MATYSEMPGPQAHMFAHHAENEDHQRHLAQRYPDLSEAANFIHGLPLSEAGTAHIPRYFSPVWPNTGTTGPYVPTDFQGHDLMNGMDQFINQQASFFREQPPTLRRQDEAENSCRPRLTAEQTASLENAFNHNPRPSTLQKKDFAVRLGLTQEKVNNWFQNRRAKNKHQTKTQKSYEVLPLRPQSNDHGTLLERSGSTDSVEDQTLSSQIQEGVRQSSMVSSHQSTLSHQPTLPPAEEVHEVECIESVGLELSRQSSNNSTQQSSSSWSIVDDSLLEQQQSWNHSENPEASRPQEMNSANHDQHIVYHPMLSSMGTTGLLVEPKQSWSPENSVESFAPADMHELQEHTKKPSALAESIGNHYAHHFRPAQVQTVDDHPSISRLQQPILIPGHTGPFNTDGSSPESCTTQVSNSHRETSLQSGVQLLDHEDFGNGMVDSWTSDFDLSLQTSQPSNIFTSPQSSLIESHECDYAALCLGFEVPSEIAQQTNLSRGSEGSFGASYSTSPEEMSGHGVGLATPRRDSTTSSDIASTMHNVHFASNFSSDRFQSPAIPHKPSIAARRHMHPAALNSSRTISSSSTVENTSPSTRDRLLPHHVRRIRSVGNCNPTAGRIQKPMLESTYCSPLMTACRESKALNSLVSIVDRVGSQNSQGHAFTQSLNSSPNEPKRYWQMSPPSEAEAPPLSATFTHQSFDDGSYVNSPPITPFTAQPPLMSQWAEHEIPQSAPAHTTGFSGHSPLMQTHPGLNTTFHSPQPQHPINHFLGQAHGFPIRQFLQDDNRLAFYSEPHQAFQRPSSSEGQITFATKSQQETPVPIQFSMVTYPPAPVQLPLRCAGNNGTFTFQNFGVKEFEESAKAQPR